MYTKSIECTDTCGTSSDYEMTRSDSNICAGLLSRCVATDPSVPMQDFAHRVLQMCGKDGCAAVKLKRKNKVPVVYTRVKKTRSRKGVRQC